MGYLTADKIAPRSEFWASYVSSSKFDYDSIMIYGSYDLSNVPGNTNVLVMEGINGGPSVFYEGGNADPSLAQISQGDIARVAQTYVKGTPDGDAAQLPDIWGQA